jgi:hypothetical protein
MELDLTYLLLLLFIIFSISLKFKAINFTTVGKPNYIWGKLEVMLVAVPCENEAALITI